ncbi:MAG: hypothetical protein WC756_11975 [Taibaiella sp.]|jgi:hypothetical protein
MNSEIECSLFIDDFTGHKTVIVTKVAGKDTEWLTMAGTKTNTIVKIGFIATEKIVFLKMSSPNCEFAMHPGDECIFLFEDKSTLKFVFEGPSNNGCNIAKIELEDLGKFASIDFNKLKITTPKSQEVFMMFGRANESAIIKNALEYQTEDEGKILLKKMANQFGLTVNAELNTVELNRVS